VPIVLPLVFSRDAMRRFMFRTISQTAIEYRQSALSTGEAGGVKAGDRLPWVELGVGAKATDNFAPLVALDWQMHVYGAAATEIKAMCSARDSRCTNLHGATMGAKGLAQNAAYLVRPDGYIGCAAGGADAAKLNTYIES
jgi:hypothetical protein